MIKLTTIATTQSGWQAKMYFVGKAKDWNLIDEIEHKKRATSAATEITQNKNFAKNSLANYNTDFYSKKVVNS